MSNNRLERSNITRSAEETQEYGRKLGEELAPNNIVAFTGDLGAGKTTFIKGLILGASQIDPREVNSPTFTTLNIYTGTKTVYHFDLYRLRSADEFLAQGFEEYFYAEGICCLEWSERIEKILPKKIIRVDISHEGENLRQIHITTVS